MADLDPYRLPTDVTPRRYALELAPDLDAATFAGTVAIDVEVHDGRRRGRAQRPRARHRRGLGHRVRRRAPRRVVTPRREVRAGPPRADHAAARRAGHRAPAVPRGPQRQAQRASTARRSPTSPAPSGSSPPPRWRPPTPARRSRAGTSRGTRRCSRCAWWCPRTSPPSATAPRSAASRPATGSCGCSSPTPSRCRPTSSPSSSARSRSPTRSTSTASRCAWRTRRARATCRRYALDVGGGLPALVHRVLRHRLPGREARPRRHPRLRLRRHGEPGLHHLPRGAAARRPGHGHHARADEPRRRRQPRDRPHVVRRTS